MTGLNINADMPTIDGEPIRVLFVEDDELLRHGLKQAIEGAGFEAYPFELALEALERMDDIQPDVILTDLYLGDLNVVDGLGVLDMVRQKDNEMPVILMTARGNIPVAIEAIRKGAYDFVEKPIDREYLFGLINRAAALRRVCLENRGLRQRLNFVSGIERILIGQSAPMRNLSNMILRLAPTPANVVILGETGAGKEMVARCLHEFSGRKGNFVAVNCAAIPETLFESELFGHEAGAFTGAARQRIGKIEFADGGTLFLDEIEAMPLAMQAKLLRMIQERSVERLGRNKPVPVDVRIVAATKVDLKEHSEKGQFRIDLHYRLNVANLRLPPLRERRDDIPLLFSHFVNEAALRFGQKPAAPDKDLLQRLIAYDWPGNVRELRNSAEQFQLGIEVSTGTQEMQASQSLEQIIASVEKAVIGETLRRHGGAANNACSELQINYSTLYRKMKQYGMDLSEFKSPAE